MRLAFSKQLLMSSSARKQVLKWLTSSWSYEVDLVGTVVKIRISAAENTNEIICTLALRKPYVFSYMVRTFTIAVADSMHILLAWFGPGPWGGCGWIYRLAIYGR